MDLSSLNLTRETKVARLQQARAAGQQIRLSIISPSDAEKNLYTQLQWSDHWIKQELIKALGNLPEICVTDYQPHAVLHLHGFPMQLDPRVYTMGWIYGHPDMATEISLRQYNHLFCYSHLFRKELERRGFTCDLMVGATSKLPQAVVSMRYPATFVGNARQGGGGRPAVAAALESGEPFLVWGNGWKGQLDSRHFVAGYIDYHQLDELYAASEFTLNDHHPDMARWGFVSFRVYDALASGGFVVSDHNPGIEEIFGRTVPQFSNGREMKEIFSYFRAHPAEKEELRHEGMRLALTHCWQARAEQIRWHLLTVADPSLKHFSPASIRSFTAQPNARERLENVNRRLEERRKFDPQRSRLTLTAGDLAPGLRVFYVDRFMSGNSNHFWLKAFRKAAAVETFGIQENIAELEGRLRAFRPHHLHLGGSVKNGMVRPELLRVIKEDLGCTISVFYGDARFSDYHTELAQVVNKIYVSNKTHIARNAEKGLHNFGYLPCPTDPHIFHPLPSKKEYDLLFIGNNNNPSRLELLKKLNAKYNLYVAGEDWQNTGLKALEPSYGENFSRLCGRARILLGIIGDEWKELEAYFSNRLVNVLASGAFLIQTYTPNLEEIFENGKHLVWYRSEDELFELVDRYLPDEAARTCIGAEGCREVTAKYTYDRSVALILNQVGALGDEKPRPSGDVKREKGSCGKISLPEVLRLNVGCGKDIRPGYVNIDKYNPAADATMDAARLEYPDSCADEIFSSHMIEHVPLAEFLKILQEWRRVLKPGGRLVILCPNFETHIRRWLEGDETFRWGGGLNCILGIQDRGEGHLNRNMFTAKRLKSLVTDAGFEIMRCEITSSRSGELQEADILCIAVKPQSAIKEEVVKTAPAQTKEYPTLLDDHWKKALEEAAQGGRFTLEWFRSHPITQELLKSPVLEGHVLEIGCGLGQRAFIAQQEKGSRITGMDASWFAVGHAFKTYGSDKLIFEVGDATRMPFPSHFFDNAYMLAVFEHIPDSAKLLGEIRRVLKPGGRLFVSVTENDYHSSPDHVHRFSHEELRRAFDQFDQVESYVRDHIIFLTARMVTQDVTVKPQLGAAFKEKTPEMV